MIDTTEKPAPELKRKVVEVPASWGERDVGKVFEITEMNVYKAEKWAAAMTFALKGTSAQIPEADYPLGAVGVMVRGINAFLGADVDIDKVWPLWEELLTCVKIIRNPTPDKVTGLPVAHPLMPNDIWEVKTLLWLRQEVLSLHVGFSILDALYGWISAILQHPASKSTPTSQPSADTSSPAAEPLLPN
jgi:hypothetical protein